jgi:hypothetical protein
LDGKRELVVEGKTTAARYAGETRVHPAGATSHTSPAHLHDEEEIRLQTTNSSRGVSAPANKKVPPRI